MKSIRDVYKTGVGPSSSHTMGPVTAAELFRNENPAADRFEVILYGSLAKTGKGHATDRAVIRALSPIPAEVSFCRNDPADMRHPNTLDLIAFRGGQKLSQIRVESIGGGDIVIEGRKNETEANDELYLENSYAEIKQFCEGRAMSLPEYVEINEGPDIWTFLSKIWNTMKASVNSGLSTEGTLPGGLRVERKAKAIFEMQISEKHSSREEHRLLSAYAYAVAEENADNGIIVTAPTCGSCGIVPAVLFYLQQRDRLSDTEILHALGVAGLFGALVKRNASVSGAECGCQAEVGVACSMAAAAAAYLQGFDINTIENAAEIALEHHLGLTCDPICGLVQVPCIERNAAAAMRAVEAADLACFGAGTRHILSFDMCVKSMYRTGRDIDRRYRETSEGGLASAYTRRGME